MSIPLIPQSNNPQQSSGGYGFINGFIPAIKTPMYQAQSLPIPAPNTDPNLIAQAIKNNETGGKQSPYSFSQPSGAGDMANGAYQIRDSELKTYAPRYLGANVTSQQFLNDPQMQDNYMNAKATSLANRGLTPQQIMAVHRGGASNLTASALDALVKAHQGYVDKGMQFIKNKQK